MRNALATAGHMAVAIVIAVVVSVIALVAIARVEWPAYPSSNQLHALTTVAQVGGIAGLFAAGWLWRRAHRTGNRRGRLLAQLIALVFVSEFSVVTLAMPLGATKLYLFGISADQQFRTEYLTRLADSPALRDMTYTDLPPFYPPGWFWLGGRAAALAGTPAWEMCKPWAITSIAIAVAVALVLWWRMIRFECALIVTTVTAAVTLAYSSPEPYAAMITVLLPPVLILTWSGLRSGSLPQAGGAPRAGGLPQAGGTPRAALVGAGIFLGLAATFYTLLLVYAAFTVVLMALLLVASRWRHGIRAAAEPLSRLAVITVIAAAIAATTWLPFLVRATHDPVSTTGTAQHYLPADGAELSFPMLQFTLLGAVCLLGTLWLVVRVRSPQAGGVPVELGWGPRAAGDAPTPRAAGLTIGVLAIYLWSLLSMLTTLAHTTLLSFRLQPTLPVLLAAAGVFGFIEVTLALAARGRDRTWGRNVIPVAATVGLAAAIGFSQNIPEILRSDLTVAYRDTDGHGQRSDHRPPSSEKYYSAIDATITRVTGLPRNETVVLTADYSFLSYYPYWGFQGLTSHYANPLAQFNKRAAAIKSWSKLKSSDQFSHALDALPWQPPTVFLMRHGAGSGSDAIYTLRLAEDVYPNQPNVRRYIVELKAALFADSHFTVTRVGPFVLAIRKPGPTS
jgi:galactan 5-O-arabinofuranosyltransferase